MASAAPEASAHAHDWAVIFRDGVPMREDGTFDEPAGIIAEGLTRIHAALREWVMDDENEAKVRADLEEGGRPVPAADASYDELVKAYLPRTDDAFLLSFLRCRRVRNSRARAACAAAAAATAGRGRPRMPLPAGGSVASASPEFRRAGRARASRAAPPAAPSSLCRACLVSRSTR